MESCNLVLDDRILHVNLGTTLGGLLVEAFSKAILCRIFPCWNDFVVWSFYVRFECSRLGS